MIRTTSIVLAGGLVFSALPGQAQDSNSPLRAASSSNPRPGTPAPTAAGSAVVNPNGLTNDQERFISAVLSFDQIGIQQAYLRKLDMNMRRKGIPLVMCAAFAEPETGNFGNSQECSTEREGSIRMLLHLGADVNAKEEVGIDPKSQKLLFGDNLLLHALRIGNPFIIKIALDDAKINVSVTDAKGETPLHLVVNPECKTVHHVFVDNVMVEERKLDKDHKLVSMESKQVKRTFRIDEVVANLIKHGADVDARNAAGETPLLVIAKAMRTMEKLENEPVNPQSDITYGNVYTQSRINLMLAPRSLLQAGADAKVADTKGNTPLSIAGSLKSGNLVRRMIEASANGHRPNETGAAATPSPAGPPPAVAGTPAAKPARPVLRPAGEQPVSPALDPNRPWMKNKDAPNIIEIK